VTPKIYTFPNRSTKFSLIKPKDGIREEEKNWGKREKVVKIPFGGDMSFFFSRFPL
jgi:hypothetical protein